MPCATTIFKNAPLNFTLVSSQSSWSDEEGEQLKFHLNNLQSITRPATHFIFLLIFHTSNTAVTIFFRSESFCVHSHLTTNNLTSPRPVHFASNIFPLLVLPSSPRSSHPHLLVWWWPHYLSVWLRWLIVC
mmetsp:Transcript_2472/g.9320  ORF Transcript_2472/g.9320 Transcript_2472/m.9320 type:complete len:131 (+) Transcript_2472:158-550(+)